MYLDEETSKFLATPCILNGACDNETEALTYDERPCFNLKSDKKYICPFFESCPGALMLREASSATVVVTTVAGLAASRIGTQKILFFEHVINQADVVLFDESDRVQKTLDDFFAPNISFLEFMESQADACAKDMKREPDAPETDVNATRYYDLVMWPGISNKKISTYKYNSTYQPEQIDIGEKGFSVPFRLGASNVRVFRIRNNDEVPDYFTASEEEQVGDQSSTSGIYKFGEVLYSVTERPNDITYWTSYTSSHIENSSQYFKEKTLVEYFPVRLCDSDDPALLVNYLDELRKLSPQYSNRPTNAPLPLHYLNLITEYFNY